MEEQAVMQSTGTEPAVVPEKELVGKKEQLPMVKRYKIVYDREACIGAAACAAIAPEFWKIAEDGKADLVDHVMEDGKQVIFVSEEKKSLIDKYKESAEVCPVRVIEIFDVDTGEKLV